MENIDIEGMIFEDTSIKAFLEAKDYAGRFGIIGSIPILALNRINNPDLKNRLWNLTFATSTNINFNYNNLEITVSHGAVYIPLRNVSKECEISLSTKEIEEYMKLLKNIPTFTSSELSKIPLQDLPLIYKISLNLEDVKQDINQLHNAIYGHGQILQQYKQVTKGFFSDAGKFVDQGELRYWISKSSLTNSPFTAVIHFGDGSLGTYSDYVGFDAEQNYVLGVRCHKKEGLLLASKFKLVE